MKTKRTHAVEAFVAADPALQARCEDEGERQQLLRTITATPRPLPTPRRPRRWRPRSLGLGIAIIALVGAGTVAALNGGLPGRPRLGRDPLDEVVAGLLLAAAAVVVAAARVPVPTTSAQTRTYPRGTQREASPFRPSTE